MKCCVIIGLLCLPSGLFAQDSALNKSTWWLGGYLKDMVWARIENGHKGIAVTNLIHNRINIQWKNGVTWASHLEVRNRFYWGKDVIDVPDFKQSIQNQNEWVNLSTTWITTRSAVVHSDVERMWLEFKRRKWNIRAGRQRINWGITNMWNPNDLFNSYNFLDFDYEERPGSDAIKGQFIISDFSNVEVAVAGTSGGTVMAAKYFTNYRHYDLQWNAGLYQGVITAGFGWAGNIKGAGFKGELQYYGDKNDSLSHFLATLESDYVFKSGWYVSAGILYNEKGIAHPLNVYNGLIFRVTPRNLIPTRWNLVLNARKEFTPIFSGSLTTVYAPGTNLLILFPSLHRNLKPNWDIDLIWQSVFVESTSFQDLNHTLFLRSRWSF